MEAIVSKLCENILNQGLSLTFSCAAVYYLYQKIKECELDRKALWERLLSYTEERRNP